VEYALGGNEYVGYTEYRSEVKSSIERGVKSEVRSRKRWLLFPINDVGYSEARWLFALIFARGKLG